MALRQLDKLGLCMNYEHRECGKQYRFVVHDHRAVVPAIWAAHQDKWFTSPPLLFRIDGHDDYTEEGIDYAAEASRVKTLDDCLLFANSLKVDDGGWVEAVVKLGWVKDAVTFFVPPEDRKLDDWHVEVADITGQNHHVFSIGGFGSRGEMRNLARAHQYQALHQALGWHPKTGWTWTEDDPPDLWFDLDLDFAVHDLRDFGRMPWRWKDFERQFTPAVVDALLPVLRTARLVTIATEPDFTCGFHGVAAVFAGLDRCFRPFGDWFAWNDM
jgi:hypothetical protein